MPCATGDAFQCNCFLRHERHCQNFWEVGGQFGVSSCFLFLSILSSSSFSFFSSPSLHTDAVVEKFVAKFLPIRHTITPQPFHSFESISPCESRWACSNTKSPISVEKEAEERVWRHTNCAINVHLAFPLTRPKLLHMHNRKNHLEYVLDLRRNRLHRENTGTPRFRLEPQ